MLVKIKRPKTLVEEIVKLRISHNILPQDYPEIFKFQKELQKFRDRSLYSYAKH